MSLIVWSEPVHKRSDYSSVALAIVCQSSENSMSGPAASEGMRAPGFSELTVGKLNGAECGIYSVIAAAKVLNHHFDEASLMGKDYVPSANGSSAGDLCRAATQIGLIAIPYQLISCSFLRASDSPVLLNLKTERRENCSGHWVAFLGEDPSGRPLIFDILMRPNTQTWDYGELLMLMSGDGVLIREKPHSPLESIVFRFSVWWHYFPIGILVALAWLIRDRMPKRFLGQSCLVLLISFCLMLIAQIETGASLIRNLSATSWIESKYVNSSVFPRVSFEQLESWRKQSKVIVVDARSPEAFDYGHIPDAVNLDIHLRASVLANNVKTWSKDNMLIVYCNNADCGWARIMASRLHANGFANVRIFDQGLEGYIREQSALGNRSLSPPRE
jgi:rhodanese-related sulfurtransferase